MTDSLDMKVLRVIHLLVTCGSVTKTADLLGVSPGAISYLLNKARQSTGSALFLRTREGMIPDNIAKELSQRYVNIAKELFDDKGMVSLNNREVMICTYSLFEFVISDRLCSMEKRPDQIHFTPPEMNDNSRILRLRSKEIDIDIGTRLPSDRSVVQTLLFTSGLKVIMSENNPAAKERFTLDDWLKCNHVRWSRQMDYVCDDYRHANRFYDLMNQRNISVVSSNSLNMALLCAHSDHVMLMPSAVSDLIVGKLPIISLSPPPELEMQFDCYLHYHHSVSNEIKLQNIIKTLQYLMNN
ncbi:TPA: LysR family transcriptional regulator [Enterobacter hormaechei subsp. hoffmannii]|nr:LysR family transcriptional regulator [Enterobacter hormaechei]